MDEHPLLVASFSGVLSRMYVINAEGFEDYCNDETNALSRTI